MREGAKDIFIVSLFTFYNDSRAPTWGIFAPGRVEKCRPPSHGLKQSKAFQDEIL